MSSRLATNVDVTEHNMNGKGQNGAFCYDPVTSNRTNDDRDWDRETGISNVINQGLGFLAQQVVLHVALFNNHVLEGRYSRNKE